MEVYTRSILVFFSLLFILTFPAFSQQSWEGNAAVIRKGEFSSPGLYAASNSFPEQTRIQVNNAQTGKSVEVTIVRRIEGAGSIFLLLSEEAGEQIGLTGSEVIQVRATIVSPAAIDLSESLREQPYTADPDLNPAVSVDSEVLEPVPAAASSPPEEVALTEAAVEVAQAPAVEEQEPVEEPAEAEVEEAEVAVEAQVEEIVETKAVETEEEAPAPAITAEEKRLEELANRIPQKQLYLPPRQQEVYALAPEPEAAEPEIAEEAEEVVEAEEAPVFEETIEEIVTEAEEIEEQPRVSMLQPTEEREDLDMELPGPETVEPEKPSPEGSRLPAPEQESPLVMEPEVPAFEVEEVVVEEEAAAEAVVSEEVPSEEAVIAMAETPTQREKLDLSATLPASTYFVQLGAYSTRNLAEKLALDLTERFSVTVLPATSAGRQFYKVLVGPLNVDESGTLLYKFRASGFKDAFIQYIE